MIVAIDGPSGAGKSTLARMLAEMLNLAVLDTGDVSGGHVARHPSRNRPER